MTRARMRMTLLVGLAVAFGMLGAAMGQNSPSEPTSSASPDQIKRGEYLARAGDCISCHTKPGGGTPYAGGLRMKTPFGDLITPNITPDVVLGGIAARNGYVPMPSFAEFLGDQQIADIANYVRTSWGNTAPSNVTPQAVASMRSTIPGASSPPKAAQ